MKIRVGYTCCMVENFLGVGFDERHIAEELRADVKKIIEDSGISQATDWELWFNGHFTNARGILVSKNRLGSYSSYNAKEITIVIPVPYIEVIPWGVNREQHTYDIDHFDNRMNNFSALGVNYAAFTNRADYIMNSLRRGIRHSFHEGFTVNKVKVKLNHTQTELLNR